MSVTHLISPLAIAPMIDWTYKHFRVFMRILAPKALLYTDMQTTGAILNNPQRALDYDVMEHPIALQVGGSDPLALAECAQMAEQYGFDEINLNLGCPSDRVQAGHFGACLMAKPQLVAECITAMKSAVNIPVTAKTRIGIDSQDSFSFFQTFIDTLLQAGCDKLIVHARKAWLKGLNPRQNRTIPPLHYDYVYQAKKNLPNLPVVINGHIQTMDDIQLHLRYVDGVMLGRLACQNPYAIAKMHHALFQDYELPTRVEALRLYTHYLNQFDKKIISQSMVLKPIMNLAHGLPGAKKWKAALLDVQQRRLFQHAYDVLYHLEN